LTPQRADQLDSLGSLAVTHNANIASSLPFAEADRSTQAEQVPHPTEVQTWAASPMDRLRPKTIRSAAVRAASRRRSPSALCGEVFWGAGVRQRVRQPARFRECS
jgi:hypothetical protein